MPRDAASRPRNTEGSKQLPKVKSFWLRIKMIMTALTKMGFKHFDVSLVFVLVLRCGFTPDLNLGDGNGPEVLGFPSFSR